MHIEEILKKITVMNNEEMLEWLFFNTLLKREQWCIHCKTKLFLRKSKSSWLGYEWMCQNIHCIHVKTCFSIKKQSIFENINITVEKFMKILIYWSQGLNQSEILKLVHISRPTLGKVRLLFLKKIEEYFLKNPIQLGGPNAIIHVDETMLTYKVKSHRGRSPRSQVWALACVDTSFSPAKGFLKIVENRSKEVLLPIIASVVRCGSTIHSDEWASYSQLGLINSYSHHTVVHKYNFLCPSTGIHTQHVESWNNKLKLKIKEMKGLTRIGRNNFVTEFCFLDTFKENAYIFILELLKC